MRACMYALTLRGSGFEEGGLDVRTCSSNQRTTDRKYASLVRLCLRLRLRRRSQGWSRAGVATMEIRGEGRAKS